MTVLWTQVLDSRMHMYFAPPHPHPHPHPKHRHFGVRRNLGGPPETILCVRCHADLSEVADVKKTSDEDGLCSVVAQRTAAPCPSLCKPLLYT